jgi:hypothetical protein
LLLLLVRNWIEMETCVTTVRRVKARTLVAHIHPAREPEMQTLRRTELPR